MIYVQPLIKMPQLGTLCPHGMELQYHFPMQSEHFPGQCGILDDSVGHRKTH